MTTIRDIAKLANVSVATVSRIINNSGKVSASTKEKVNKIINETNYHPNQVARTLYQKRSKMIGIIIPFIENVFYARIINGVQSVLQPAGYTCLVSFNVGSDSQKYQNEKQIDYTLQEINEDDTYDIGAKNALKKISYYDAIITVNDIYAAHILKLAKKRKLKVPEDFQLVGYDNNELSEFTTPTLSTIDQQPELIGKTAAKRLLEMIQGEKSTENSLIDIKVVKRESTK